MTLPPPGRLHLRCLTAGRLRYGWTVLPHTYTPTYTSTGWIETAHRLPLHALHTPTTLHLYHVPPHLPLPVTTCLTRVAHTDARRFLDGLRTVRFTALHTSTHTCMLVLHCYTHNDTLHPRSRIRTVPHTCVDSRLDTASPTLPARLTHFSLRTVPFTAFLYAHSTCSYTLHTTFPHAFCSCFRGYGCRHLPPTHTPAATTRFEPTYTTHLPHAPDLHTGSTGPARTYTTVSLPAPCTFLVGFTTHHHHYAFLVAATHRGFVATRTAYLPPAYHYGYLLLPPPTAGSTVYYLGLPAFGAATLLRVFTTARFPTHTYALHAHTLR